MKSLGEWLMRNRIVLGAIVTIATGAVHIYAPDTRLEALMVLIGTNLASAGLFKSDQYHRDKQDAAKEEEG